MKPRIPLLLACSAATLFVQTTRAQNAGANALVSLADGPIFLHSNEASTLAATTPMLSASGALTDGHAFAAADLPNGTLKVSVGGTFAKPGTDWVMAGASFSDTFTTTTLEGGPFVWTDATTARFNLSLDGFTFLNAAFDSSDASALFFGPKWEVSITAAHPDDYARWRQGDPTAVVSQARYSAREGFDHLSNPGLYYDGLFTSLTASGDLMSGLDLQFDLMPGGDFTWVVSLNALGALTDSFLIDTYSFEIDLSHTATVSYIGPANSITYSLSGFPGTSRTTTNPVPEPSTYGMLAVSLIALAALRRKMRDGEWGSIRG